MVVLRIAAGIHMDPGVEVMLVSRESQDGILAGTNGSLGVRYDSDTVLRVAESGYTIHVT